MSYTPGPWVVGVFDDTGGYDCMFAGIRVGQVVIDGADYGQKAYEDIPADAKERMMADARLIAAAPELADELRHFADLIDSAIENGVTIPGLATTNKARALLARIKGE